MKAPVEDFLETVLPRPANTGEFGAVIPQIFIVPSNCVVLNKIVLIIW